MKHLKIEDRKAYFTRGESWMVVTEMTKDDLLNLAYAAIDEDDFETDVYDETLLPNPAHKIIYCICSPSPNRTNQDSGFFDGMS